MAVAAVSFQWLDALEKEFDIAFVDLDTLLGSGVLEQLEEADLLPDGDEPGGLTGAVRHKLGTLASCWTQLSHKAQTIFQNNAKIEIQELIQLTPALAMTPAGMW